MVAQRKLTAAEYIAWSDIMVQAIDALLTAKGAEDTAGTASHFAADLRAAINGLLDPDTADITIDLLAESQALVEAMLLESSVSSMFSRWNSAVTRHLGSDVNTLLSDAGLRVHHLWKRAGNLLILPHNAFPPVTILGTYAVTGSGVGTLTKSGGGACSTSYADAALEIKVVNQQLGAAAITATVVGTDIDGTVQTHTCTIDSGAVQDSVWDVGTDTTDFFYTVTSVTITGGTNGDDLQIQTKEDRTVV
jgi:hypothetical protein